MQKILSTLLLLTFSLYGSIDISHSLNDKPFKASHQVYVKPHDNIRLRFKFKEAKEIRWYQIIPNTSKFYKNANHPWEANAYKWTGYGKINYRKVEIKSFRNKSIVEITPEILEANRPHNSKYYNSKMGSFWFEAEVVLKNGKRMKSVGFKDNSNKGLSPKVLRLSFMSDEGYIGYLSTFFNVPGIFGSMPYQSRNYIGIDCADVLIAASKKMNHEKNEKNYNVKMLVAKLKNKVKFTNKKGKLSKRLKWGKDFKRGDFVAVKYTENGRYAHIGMLYEDTNQNSILDAKDSILNAGPNALHTTTLESGAFSGTVVILENKDVK